MTDQKQPPQAHCPNCHFEGEQIMFATDWQEELVSLICKYPEQGITEPELNLMTVPDQFGVYLRLKGLAENGQN